LVAERERLDACLRAPRDAEELHGLAGPPGGVGPLESVQPREVHELLVHAHLRVQPSLLGHVAEPPPGTCVHRLALPADLAAIGLEDAQHDPHRRRLAGAVAADEADHLSGFDRERDAVERDGAVEAPRDVDQLEHGHPGAVMRDRIR
jgi:hypothetical protein